MGHANNPADRLAGRLPELCDSTEAVFGPGWGELDMAQACAYESVPGFVQNTSCLHDCGGICVLKVHVEDGVIRRIETDDGQRDQLRACQRGRSYRRRVYAPDRLKYPLIRTGERGEGKFRRATWGEALDLIADQMLRIKREYGPEAILNLSMAGSMGRLHNHRVVRRLLNKFGGQTVQWGGYSYGGAIFASGYTFGTSRSGNDREDLLNSRLIILWGMNPAETVWGTNTNWHLARAKEAGIKFICVDPRFHDAAAALADQWIPIKPGTDAAMLIAMAYVIITEGLHDQAFLDKYTIGFDEDHLPVGAPPGSSFKSYVLGLSDGVPKTPDWAEGKCGVPVATIAELAREYATTNPAAFLSGWAAGRTAFGEQYHRAAITLAAMTGNVGISGGDAAGIGFGFRVPIDVIPPGKGPAGWTLDGGQDRTADFWAHEAYDYRPNLPIVHSSRVWDAIIQGKSGGYPSDIKMLIVAMHNPLTQGVNTNEGIRALKELDFVVVHEQFMTSTARYADVVLPINTWFEREDIATVWFVGRSAMYLNKVIEPMYGSKSDIEVCTELAKRLGIPDYNDKSDEEWLRELAANSEIPDFDKFKREGIHRYESERPLVAFKAQIEDPDNNPFPTPSGKIEIYSDRIAKLNYPNLPPIPTYIEPREGPRDPLVGKYPLQLVTPHSRKRTHSIYNNISWLREIEPHQIWMNPIDAQERRLAGGELVTVFNDRGTTILTVKVTGRMMPGVVAVEEGVELRLDQNGIDWAGSVNVLSNSVPSPGGASAYNSCLVQVARRAE